MKPFVKWAGGKRQILDRIMKYLDNSIEDDSSKYTRYVEPFLGGGAVFFNLKPEKAIINDLNEDLINAYRIIASDRYLDLIEKLKEHDVNYREDKDGYYYEIRQWDRENDWPNNHNDVDRAARMIFLNRTCYNGLYRVNSKGQFNTPIGRYSNPTICDEANITAVHNFFVAHPEIQIRNGSYSDVLMDCGQGDLVYLDPPYDYNDDDGFTKYQMSGFTFSDFEQMKKCCDIAIDKGATIVISNNATERVLNLFIQDHNYTAYYPDTFNTLRNINCKGDERKTGYEVIIVGVSYRVVPQANDMEKVIKIATSGKEVLTDKEYAKSVIGVTTDRQVAYYLSALSFFGYLTSTKSFTEDFLKMNFNRKLVESNIYSILKNDKFKPYFDNDFQKKEEISAYIQQKEKLSKSTADRRASTIKAWMEWCKSYKNI